MTPLKTLAVAVRRRPGPAVRAVGMCAITRVAVSPTETGLGRNGGRTRPITRETVSPGESGRRHDAGRALPMTLLMTRAVWMLLLCASAAFGAGPREETFGYEVKWPSGLALGEAQMKASRDTGRWILEFQVEASVPGFRVMDRYRSVVDDKYCTQEFEKEFEHGARKGKETTTFANGRATRVTANGGGKSEFDAPGCARDALAYLFFVRDEVARGRIPVLQKLYFGAGYDVKLQFGGAEAVKVSEAPLDTDKFRVTVTTTNGKVELDLFLARDEARTPALVRVPFAMGNFSMEWLR